MVGILSRAFSDVIQTFLSAEHVRGRSLGSSSTPGGVRGSGCDDFRSHFHDAGNERTTPAGDNWRRGCLWKVGMRSVLFCPSICLVLFCFVF